MSDNLEADTGLGPYTVTKGTGSWSVTLDGKTVKGPYGAAKTANRACRELNASSATFLDEEPEEVLEEPKPVYVPKPKGRNARKAVEPKPAPVTPKPALVAPKVESGPVLFATRDEWLNAFIAAARPVFKAAGLELPEKVRASIGWMFRSSNKKTLGQCWHEASSADGTREIWINPMLGGDDSSRIADVLTHELTHTLFGPEEKHGKNFKAAVHKLGLEGKATATIAGEGWREWADPILATLGPIPHAALDPSLSGVKKKQTYLLKATCKTCEFVFRATAKHLNGKALTCPDAECGGTVEVDGAEDLGEGDGE